jgi:hypothetical protein
MVEIKPQDLNLDLGGFLFIVEFSLSAIYFGNLSG